MSSLKQSLDTFYHEYPILSKQDIQTLVAFALKKKKEELFLSLEEKIEQGSIDQIKMLLDKRKTECPIEYIMGYVEFFGCTIRVNRSVLIPRVETEILLDLIFRKVKGRKIEVVFDVCTGSGCLGIGFKKEHPESLVYLSDISEEALSLAQINATNNQVEVTCLLGDLMEPFEGIDLADLVICNPPYISDKEFTFLEPSVKEFEPRSALTSGFSGLEIFQRLSTLLPRYMKKGAILALEIGSTQKKEISKIFNHTSWSHFECIQDYAGLDRFIFLEVE